MVRVLEEHDARPAGRLVHGVTFNRHQNKRSSSASWRVARILPVLPGSCGPITDGLSPHIRARPGRIWLQQFGGGATATS